MKSADNFCYDGEGVTSSQLKCAKGKNTAFSLAASLGTRTRLAVISAAVKVQQTFEAD